MIASEIVNSTAPLLSITYWMAVAYVFLLIPMRFLRRASLASQVAWTAVYAFTLWHTMYHPKGLGFFLDTTWFFWIGINLVYAVLFSRRIIFGTRCQDIAWYGTWVVATVGTESIWGTELVYSPLLRIRSVSQAFSPDNLYLVAFALIHLLLIAAAVLLRDLYKGYLPWLHKSQ